MVYNCILDSAEVENKSTEEKLNLIAQKINQYMQEIEELKERLKPMTLPEFQE
jgi:predicted  nucleic acid-binding Zn-ribbon protein